MAAAGLPVVPAEAWTALAAEFEAAAPMAAARAAARVAAARVAARAVVVGARAARAAAAGVRVARAARAGPAGIAAGPAAVEAMVYEEALVARRGAVAGERRLPMWRVGPLQALSPGSAIAAAARYQKDTRVRPFDFVLVAVALLCIGVRRGS